jgi:hypothetical protein
MTAVSLHPLEGFIPRLLKETGVPEVLQWATSPVLEKRTSLGTIKDLLTTFLLRVLNSSKRRILSIATANNIKTAI